MYSIGAFAQLGGVTVRMLRHYDHIGLLVPADVIPSSGRRRNDAEQLPRLNRLVALKHLGFPLEQVRTLLDDGIDAAELQGMLRLRAADLETRLLRDGQTLDRVRARLRLIESEAAMTVTDVEIKTVAPQRVLALHQSLAEDSDRDDSGVEALFERVIAAMDAAHADRASPISWQDDYEHTPRLHAGFLTPTAQVPGLDVVDLPGSTVASVVRRGDVADMNEAHQAIARWAEAHDHSLSVERGSGESSIWKPTTPITRTGSSKCNSNSRPPEPELDLSLAPPSSRGRSPSI
jgi:DNA-binding transcriptional MerR regulator